MSLNLVTLKKKFVLSVFAVRYNISSTFIFETLNSMFGEFANSIISQRCSLGSILDDFRIDLLTLLAEVSLFTSDI